MRCRLCSAASSARSAQSLHLLLQTLRYCSYGSLKSPSGPIMVARHCRTVGGASWSSHVFVRNLKSTGLTQNLGGLNRDFQSNCWVNLRFWVNPVNFTFVLSFVQATPCAPAVAV
jgi:hypothetical protein